MLITVPVKLLADNDSKALLLKSTYQFNAACNYVSKIAFEKKIFNQIGLQKETYYDIREKFKLPSQYAARVIGRIVDSYRINKQIKHTFKKISSVDFDLRNLSLKDLISKNKISISTVDKTRLKIDVVFGNYAFLNKRNIKNSSKLVYKKGEFYLQLAVEVPEAPLVKSDKYLGVDMGIINLATASTGSTFSGKNVDKNRKRFTILKGNLQSKSTKSAKRHLKKISKIERNFKKNENHKISKQIVKEAKALGFSIALEELKGFKKTVNKSQRGRLGKWAFGELSAYIMYKAKIEGVEVVKVNPHYTSMICSKCHYCSHKNRINQKDFKCKRCNVCINADLNAAINIAARADVNRPIAVDYAEDEDFPEWLNSKPTALAVGN